MTMLKFYKELSKHGVVMSMKASNEYQIVQIQFEKSAICRRYVYTYDMACDPIRWEDALLDHLSEFLFIYEQECIKRRRAMSLRDHLWKEKK